MNFRIGGQRRLQVDRICRGEIYHKYMLHYMLVVVKVLVLVMVIYWVLVMVIYWVLVMVIYWVLVMVLVLVLVMVLVLVLVLVLVMVMVPYNGPFHCKITHDRKRFVPLSVTYMSLLEFLVLVLVHIFYIPDRHLNIIYTAAALRPVCPRNKAYCYMFHQVGCTLMVAGIQVHSLLLNHCPA
jgi:hypothetical protein